jgi:hypothetical protein
MNELKTRPHRGYDMVQSGRYVGGYIRFGETYVIHIQGRSESSWTSVTSTYQVGPLHTADGGTVPPHCQCPLIRPTAFRHTLADHNTNISHVYSCYARQEIGAARYTITVCTKRVSVCPVVLIPNSE